MVGPTTHVQLHVDDIASYLAATGWEQDAHGSLAATLWQHPDDYEVLVPARDGMGDGERRIREILRCLSAVEDRAAGDIALEIARPGLDKLLFRTFPVGHDSGYTSLTTGVQAVQGVRDILSMATRTVVQGPHFSFPGRSPNAVGQILRAAELGPSRAGSYIVEMRLPTDAAARITGGEDLAGRAVIVQMLDAVTAAQAAAQTNEPAAFDDTVTAGVSANLCQALSDLSGPQRDEPFEITFRWARSYPLEVPSQVVAFPENSGSLLHDAAQRLRSLRAFGPATVTGVIEGLHDDAAGGDRWRVKVRGSLRTEHMYRARRTIWLRLADQATYHRAITAHRRRSAITATGELSSATGRVELVPGEITGL